MHPFQICVDQLRDGKEEEFSMELSAQELDLPVCDELVFQERVAIYGRAYIASKELVLHVYFSSRASIPCPICNVMYEHTLEIPPVTHVVSLETIQGGVFDLRPMCREEICLHTPSYQECAGEQQCPQRQVLASYFAGGEKDALKRAEDSPFKDI